MKIKAGDKVVVIAGKDRMRVNKKGELEKTTGTVLKVFPKTDRVIVEGVNIVKKHQKPTQQNQSGSIIEQEAPIHVSNVMLVDPKTNEPTRIGYKVETVKVKDRKTNKEVEKKQKVRYAVKSKTLLDK